MRTLLCLTSLAGATAAQSTPATPTFAAPVRIEAGGKWLGSTRLYPSPVLHDVNGDGRADLVIGDLRGHLTVSLRQPGQAPQWTAETPMLANDGERLDFHNW